MKTNRLSLMGSRSLVIVGLAAFLLAPAASVACAAEQKTFPTARAAVTALVAAVKTRTTDQVLAILGPEIEGVLMTRNKWENEIDREAFLDASRAVKLEAQKEDANTVIAYLGKDEWPFPAPLVKTPAGWKFDGKAAVQEIKDREIGRNELSAIAACLTYIDVQLEYLSLDRVGDGYLQFAQKINSTPGKFDGLYWSNAYGEELSPIGPFVAQAAGAEKDVPGGAAPIFGYYFKILTAQGDAAPGGARSYLVNGRMLSGFALVAWPAEYGVSGVSTFIVNQLGTVYQKDLGPNTAQVAGAIAQYNPDNTWAKAE